MPLVGDTIRLKGEFRDFDGELTDPDEAKVIIYDSQRNKVEEYNNPVRSDVGEYYLDYIVPFGTTNIMFFEFKGNIGGMPIAGRMSFERKWV